MDGIIGQPIDVKRPLIICARDTCVKNPGTTRVQEGYMKKKYAAITCLAFQLKRGPSEDLLRRA
jgi:hypothetical protein